MFDFDCYLQNMQSSKIKKIPQGGEWFVLIKMLKDSEISTPKFHI